MFHNLLCQKFAVSAKETEIFFPFN